MWRRLTRRTRRNAPGPADTHSQARLAIASCLSGGDSGPAWNAVWDLAHSKDVEAKRDVLEMLRRYIDSAVSSPRASREATNYFEVAPGSVDFKVDHQWNKIEHACDFESVLERSLRGSFPKTLPSREVRAMNEQRKQDQHDETLRNMGVALGEGLPMWALYMTRRSKRSWH